MLASSQQRLNFVRVTCHRKHLQEESSTNQEAINARPIWHTHAQRRLNTEETCTNQFLQKFGKAFSLNKDNAFRASRFKNTSKIPSLTIAHSDPKP